MIEYKTVTLQDFPILMSDWKRVLSKYGKDGWEYVMHDDVRDDEGYEAMDILLKRKTR
jgi:hypothetical protein